MKYQKIFESFNDIYYEEITWPVFYEGYSAVGEPFLESEVEKLKSFRTDKTSVMHHDNWPREDYIRISAPLTDAYIYKCLDDYFYVELHNEKKSKQLYKCDQFDGLIKLLNDVL